MTCIPPMYRSMHTNRNNSSPCRFSASLNAFSAHWQIFCTCPRFANIIHDSGRVTLSTSPNDSIKGTGIRQLRIRVFSPPPSSSVLINHKFVKFVIHDEIGFKSFERLHNLWMRRVGISARMKHGKQLGISFAIYSIMGRVLKYLLFLKNELYGQ